MWPTGHIQTHSLLALDNQCYVELEKDCQKCTKGRVLADVPLSSATFPHLPVKGPKRRLEALCANTCVAVSSGMAPDCIFPAIEAVSEPGGFTLDLNLRPNSANGQFSLECSPAAATWRGTPKSMSTWVVDQTGNVHSCVAAEDAVPRSEALSHGDRLVAISSSLTEGIPQIALTLEMALCDDPSPTTAGSWILDAADELGLVGPHVVALWRVT